MSLWAVATGVATRVAATEAANLPVTGAGTLATQVKIFGFGVDAIGTSAAAIAHQQSPYVALAAVGIGVAALALLPEAALLGGAAMIANAALPALGGLISQGALTAIVAGVLEAGAAGIIASIAAPVLNKIFEEVGDLLAPDKPSEIPFGPYIPDVFGPFQKAPTVASPLILDLDGDGVELLQANTSVYWDIDNDGFAEASGWAGKDDGLLALDANKNGRIDNHAELFGDTARDGFKELRTLDTNKDNVMDAKDKAFKDLRVWKDKNSDGVTQTGELYTLAQLGIKSINLKDKSADQWVAGNQITNTSTYTMTNGTTRKIVDAWFGYDARSEVGA